MRGKSERNDKLIIYRYLAKEVSTALLAVTFVLVLVFLSNQIVHYLSYAASGKIAVGVLLRLILLQLPYLLGLLLPIGLFFGILLGLGRLYVDNEMTVLFACGISRWQLLVVISRVSVVVVIIVAVLTLWLNPLIAARKDQLVSGGSPENALLQTMIPGRFMSTYDDKRVFYVEDVLSDHKRAQNLFMAERSGTGKDQQWTVLSAQSGYQSINLNSGDHFIVAKNGYRYQGTPGQNNFLIIKFGQYGVKAKQMPQSIIRLQEDAKSTAALWRGRTVDDMAELQWRFSIPLVALVFTVLGIPLSRVKVRKGRYAQLLPAILICIIYVNLLFVARAWLERHLIPSWLGLWWVHVIFLILALTLYIKGQKNK